VETTDWVAMLERLKQQGKIRYYGVSCDTLEAAHAALEHPGVSSLQLSISLLERRVLSTLPLAHARGVAVIAREVLANGLLVKKASEIDLRSYCESDEEAAAKALLLNEYREAATERGSSLTRLALEFVTGLEGVSVSLVGVSRLEQLNALLAGGVLGPARQAKN
jgi:aryl-alcohol dehydrogenase-like predicted oxidoreductase